LWSSGLAINRDCPGLTPHSKALPEYKVVHAASPQQIIVTKNVSFSLPLIAPLSHVDQNRPCARRRGRVAQHHVHQGMDVSIAFNVSCTAGALRELHRPAGEAAPEHLPVRVVVVMG
jgi:hypothetical protein